MLRCWIRVVVLLLAACACSLPAWAVSNVTHEGYSIRIWQSEDGLPQNTVTAITQTRDGYIWIGTLAGLARFDGERFLTYDSGSTPSLPDSRISALYEDAKGTLWIGHDTGQISRYREGHFELLPGKPGPEAKTLGIGADENGVVWLLRADGLLTRAESPWPPLAENHNEQPKKLRFARTAAGRIWISSDGEAEELRDGQLRPVDLGPAQYTGYVRALGPAFDGGWWIVRDKRIRKWTNGTWSADRGTWGTSEINVSLELRDGSLAYATMDDGLHLIRSDGSRLVFNHQTSSLQNWVRVLYEDREGNLWIGAGSGGLAVARRTGLTALNAPDNWQGSTVLTVAPGQDGALWVGTEGAGVYRYAQNQWRHYGTDQGFGNLFIWSITTDAHGRVWAGTWGGGVYRQQEENFVHVPEFKIGAAPVFALHFNQTDQALWLGTGDGLLTVHDGHPTWLLHEANPQVKNVVAFTQDAQGVIWLALSEGGLGRFHDGKFQRFGQPEGLSSNTVQCLLLDGDSLWIGTGDGGLNRLRAGRFSAIGVKQGVPSKTICHIADDGMGHLWLSTHHGLFRVAKEELHRCADGLIPAVTGQVYDKNDGLPTIEYSGGMQAAGCRTGDGRLWFASNKGLVHVDPAAIQINPLAPPVAIESWHVDGQPVVPAGAKAGPVSLPPEHQRLEFQFTALSLAASGKNLFKYRMHGLDENWIDAGTKRSAFYSHLPAGQYRFQVIACNNDRVWNNDGASVSFTVRPFYWHTWWFRGAVVLTVLGTVSWAVRHETRRRMQRRVEELEHARRIEQERARIAQDIHDDIGSSLTRITLLSQSARPEADQPYRAANVLERIHDTALEVTHTLDEIVWAVNPQHDTLDSLACYLARFAQERLGDAQVGCRLDLPLNLPPWPLSTQIRHDVLMAFKEAINNTLKHSGATEVKVALELGQEEFVISVQDNGCGFDPTPAPGSFAHLGGGNGLGNLRRRLEKIGGVCEIISAHGRGTRIAFSVRLTPGTAHPAETIRHDHALPR